MASTLFSARSTFCWPIWSATSSTLVVHTTSMSTIHSRATSTSSKRFSMIIQVTNPQIEWKIWLGDRSHRLAVKATVSSVSPPLPSNVWTTVAVTKSLVLEIELWLNSIYRSEWDRSEHFPSALLGGHQIGGDDGTCHRRCAHFRRQVHILRSSWHQQRNSDHVRSANSRLSDPCPFPRDWFV